MEEILPYLDYRLAAVRVSDRPLLAAAEFVKSFVMEWTRPDGTTASPPDEFEKIVLLPEFRLIYRTTRAWYDKRYGEAAKPSKRALIGAVSFFGQPFRVLIPATVRLGPGDVPGSWWFQWPDRVLDQEDPLTWLDTGPSVDALTDPQKAEALEAITQTATKLRRVNVKIMGVGAEGPLAGLLASSLDYLEKAATLLLEGDGAATQKSYWEMQMACECALKSALQHAAGSFKESHDLFHLFDLLTPHIDPPFDRSLLKELPRWKEMTDLRYAVGERTDRHLAFECYETTLAIVSDTLSSLPGLGIGSAEFLLKAPPPGQSPPSETD